MDVAGLLLTGGSSRRMGRDKATLPCSGTTLADHLGRQLQAVVTGPALEIGPGRSGLRAVADDRPGAGPLAAVATGASALATAGWSGPALVLATDLPGVTAALLAWLAGHPAAATVVPLDAGGRRQLLCARYARTELDRAVAGAAAGRRAMSRALDGAVDLVEVPEAAWAEVAGAGALQDVDAPEDLIRGGLCGAGP